MRYLSHISDRELRFLAESNAIEGVRDVDSLLDSVDAWLILKYLTRRQVLDTQTLLSVHENLMRNQPIPDKYKGAFRDVDVYVGGHKGAAPELVHDLIEEWVVKVRRRKEDTAKQDHVDFELIHPFVDGNGRMGRMLYNWQRLKNKRGIEIFWEKDKREYYKWFK